jgi:hypothetical protein
MFIKLGGGAKNIKRQRFLKIPKTQALDHNCDGGMIDTPSVFDRDMTSSIDGSINHGICMDQHQDEVLIVQNLAPYAAALFFAISMIILAFGKASRQSTIVNQSGWKMMMPLPITLSCFVFFAFLTSHGCVFGYDEVGDNHRAVHRSIRGTNAAMVKPNDSDRDGSMITKVVKVRKPTSICLVLFYHAL